MSVNYSLQAATASVWSILRVLVLWKGSLWKLIWRELSLWLVLFTSLNIIYYCLIKNSIAADYYKIIITLKKESTFDSTMMFLLTYMTHNSLTRWSETYKLLMWPENIALLFKQYCNEKAMSKQESENLRSSIVRYLTTFYILVFRDVSTEVRELFPTFESLVELNIITGDELKLLRSSRLSNGACFYWIPIDWIILLVKKKYRPKYICDSKKRKIRNTKESIMTEYEYCDFIIEIGKLRAKIGDILSFDWVPVPLAFIQTITVFVYSTLIVNTIRMHGRIISEQDTAVFLTEIFTECISTLPFSIVYLAFLRISQVVINPFGRDDDDFETPYLIQRHFNVLREILYREDNNKMAKMKTEENAQHTTTRIKKEK